MRDTIYLKSFYFAASSRVCGFIKGNKIGFPAEQDQINVQYLRDTYPIKNNIVN